MATRETPAHYLVLWAIMEDERLSAGAKCVAIALLLKYRNHKTSQCNPSFGELAKSVGRKRRSVIDALNELKAFGWIDWQGTKGGSPSNTNNFHFFLQPQPVQPAAPVQCSAPVQENALTGAAERTQPVQYTAHEPSKNHLNHSGASKRKGQILGSTTGVRVHSDSPQADQWRRYWVSIGQPQPAFSQRDGYYLKPLPSLLPPEITGSAAA
ncbi:helix-turn-helix domain-containing protein [Bradyrhizobium sp. Ash2021]|uniref:helix-turn-helix domain-containing protein n=1 Tax=Bradyrhizobium sp. Ash2021 TaxID=2954771 RepID=UPI002815C9A2|nr:helix-turn-helix domain-containing protein [Bradyrhizobium sp. Ash2021]WMT78854.1 helix-turn-helix domain-containing protein [Bradyrhizobium sp. Ash2021]